MFSDMAAAWLLPAVAAAGGCGGGGCATVFAVVGQLWHPCSSQ